MAEESSMNASFAETLKNIQERISDMTQKFSDVEKVVNTLQTSQISLSQNVSTIQSRVRSLSTRNPLGVRRSMFSLPGSRTKNGTSGQTTPDATNIVTQSEDSETQFGDDVD
jgi:prophage DNA circulation protein